MMTTFDTTSDQYNRLPDETSQRKNGCCHNYLSCLNIDDDPTGEIFVKTVSTVCIAPIIIFLILVLLPFVTILGGVYIVYQLSCVKLNRECQTKNEESSKRKIIAILLLVFFYCDNTYNHGWTAVWMLCSL
eukprot:238203_1